MAKLVPAEAAHGPFHAIGMGWDHARGTRNGHFAHFSYQEQETLTGGPSPRRSPWQAKS